ncbi:hypothetical protein [Luteimonas sp. SDU82]|uniref:hypothetical protein n=1 Tax=Luteimonas sp. SDU82 TaxID=3422592 RepID=UPI003EBDA60A
MSWDPFQRDALEAMGLRLYEVHGASVAQDPAPVPVEPVAANDTSHVPASVGMADGALLRALLRACGRGADDAAALALCRGLLAGGLPDAAARRALWPRLRALRTRPAR